MAILAILVATHATALAGEGKEARKPHACKCAKAKPRLVVKLVQDGGDAERASAVGDALRAHGSALASCLELGRATARLTFKRGARAPKVAWSGDGSAASCLRGMSWGELPRAARRSVVVVDLSVEMRR